MSGDLKIRFDEALLEGDLIFESNDLAQDDTLANSVFVSLFTDARASLEDELPDPNSTDRRGWWGDKILGFSPGSKLWLLDRSKVLDETLNQAIEYSEESLQWMVDDGIAEEVDVDANWEETSPGTWAMDLTVTITKDSTTIFSETYQLLWDNTAAIYGV